MALTDYTTPNDVRAALGVSKTEINDAAISTLMHESIILEAMDSVHELVHTRYQEIKNLVEANRTKEQVKFFRTAQLFNTYALADHLTRSLPMFSVRSITDGKAEFTRASKALEIALEQLQGMFAVFKYRLGLALNALEGTQVIDTSYSAIVTSTVVGLGTDPVRGS